MEGGVGRSLVVSAEIAEGSGRDAAGGSGSEEEEGGRFARVRGSVLRRGERVRGLDGGLRERRCDDGRVLMVVGSGLMLVGREEKRRRWLREKAGRVRVRRRDEERVRVRDDRRRRERRPIPLRHRIHSRLLLLDLSFRRLCTFLVPGSRRGGTGRGGSSRLRKLRDVVPHDGRLIGCMGGRIEDSSGGRHEGRVRSVPMGFVVVRVRRRDEAWDDEGLEAVVRGEAV